TFHVSFTDAVPGVGVSSASISVPETGGANAVGTFADYDDAVTITASLDGGPFSTAGVGPAAGNSGNWSWAQTTPLDEGSHTVVIQATCAPRFPSSFPLSVTDAAPGVGVSSASISVSENSAADAVGTFVDYDDAVTITASLDSG